MRIPRIYHPDIIKVATTIILSDAAAKHVNQVLRLETGAQLTLFNGKGGEFSATIMQINKRSVEVLIGEYSPREVESPLQIHLAQAISRGEKMDFTIQKAVELGVTQITPLLTERCAIKLTPDRWEKKHAHWQAVIISACEQSGRNSIPVIHPPIEISKWLGKDQSGLKCVLHPGASHSLSSLPKTNEVTLLVGSEGGLSENELNSASSQQFLPIAIGPRILRTETAALAVISVLQSCWGDF
jgi:16S rRNA (uracil1498-N3)-methyltransferase